MVWETLTQKAIFGFSCEQSGEASLQITRGRAFQAERRAKERPWVGVGSTVGSAEANGLEVQRRDGREEQGLIHASLGAPGDTIGFYSE